MLSGKYLDDKPEVGRYAKSDPGGRLGQLPLEKLRTLRDLSHKYEMSMTTLSLAWVAGQPGITSPIIGARSEAQLRESAAACERKLDEELLKEIDELFEPGSHHVNYYQANFGPNVRPR
jgi:aryl-alcohol dehydrogenase-like predicted oxidoreductase